MTLNEKSAGSFAGDSAGSSAGDSAGSFAGSYAEISVAVSTHTFSDVVDKACQKLMDRQAKHTIQRIQEMKECLAGLEKELDDFLQGKNRKTG